MTLIKRKGKDMQVYFLHHSAVCVKMEKSLLIFDYYLPDLGDGMKQGSISDKEIEEAERVYVFASHVHHDHYNPYIFKWDRLNENIVFVLDDTIKGTHERAVKMMRGDEFSDGYIKVTEFGSTDIGGSFYVECEGKSIYHAGDFNFWHWRDEGDEKYSRQMKIYFERELKFLRNKVESIDVAFFPVDKRMGSDFDEGADMFIETMKPEMFVPIHFMSFDDTKEFMKKHKNNDTKVLAVKKNGQRLV